MADISELFGQLRSMLSSFKPREAVELFEYDNQINALHRILREAQALDPARYASEWHAYLHHFANVLLFAANSLVGLEELELLLPASIPITFQLRGTTNADETQERVEEICEYAYPERISGLVISSINRGQEALSRLFALDFPSLKRVRIAKSSLQKKTMEVILASNIFPHIERLELCDVTYRPKTTLLEMLLKAERLSSLQTLELSNSEVHPIDLAALCALKLPASLKTIDLTRAYLKDDQAVALASAAHIDSAHINLILEQNMIRPAGLIALVDAGLLDAKVVLEGTGQYWSASSPLSSADASVLAECGYIAQMKRYECVVSKFEATALAGRVLQSQHLYGLESLVLNLNDVQAHRFQDLFDMLAQDDVLKGIKELTIKRADGLSIEHIQTLMRSRWFLTLQSLELSVCDLKDEHLTALLQGTYAHLTTLHLNWNKLTLRKISFGASLPALVHLDLSHNRLGEQGVSNLMSASWPHLERLSLASNRLGDKGVMALMASPLVASLSELVLTGNDTSMDGVQAVLDSPHLRDPSCVSLERLEALLKERDSESISKLMFDLNDLQETRAASRYVVNERDILNLVPRLHHLWSTEREAFLCRVSPWIDAHCTESVSVHSIATFKMAADVLPERVEIALRVRGHGKDRSNKAAVGIFSELEELRDHPRFTLLYMSDLHKVQREMKAFFEGPPFAHLRALIISHCDVQGAWARAFVGAPILDTLERLEVSLPSPSEELATALARSAMPALKALTISTTEAGLGRLARAPWIGQLERLILPLPNAFPVEVLLDLLRAFKGALSFDWRQLSCSRVSQLVTLIERGDMVSPKKRHYLLENPHMFWSVLTHEALLEEDAVEVANHPFLAQQSELSVRDFLPKELDRNGYSRPRERWSDAEIEEVTQRLTPLIRALCRSEVFRPKKLRLEPFPWPVVSLFLESLLGSPAFTSLEAIEVDGRIALYDDTGRLGPYREIMDWMLTHQRELAHLEGIRCVALTYTKDYSNAVASVLRRDQLEAMKANPALFVSGYEIERGLKCLETSE